MERLDVDKHTSLLGPSDISYKENEGLENDSCALAIKSLTRAFHKKTLFFNSNVLIKIFCETNWKKKKSVSTFFLRPKKVFFFQI
jgi:hypothetical protein